MLLSYKWLATYVDLAGITPQVLADKLTNAGLEVEGIKSIAAGTNLVIGEIISCKMHPDSDHLKVCSVNIGKEVLEIVCGAKNACVGLKVIVAKVGAVLPEMTIKAGAIRGVMSNGMLCSLKELGVSEKHLSAAQINGIEELDDKAVIGNEKVLAYLGLDDVILDVSLTPNRVDFLAMFSAAHEVGAILERTVTLPAMASKKEDELKPTLKIAASTSKCSKFIGKYIGHVKIKQSPKWMIDRLHASGIKAINNVVDISNYVMLETGQPLHFYDASKNPRKTLIASDGQAMDYLALDGNTYAITADDIIITDGERCVGIAGIMGGDDSKIDETTTKIIIEAASFSHVSIRNSARRLNVNTDASMRFAKGIEPNASNVAVERCIGLLKELADAGEIEESVVYETEKYEPTIINFNLAFINKRLGTTYSLEQVMNVLNRLAFNPVVSNENISVTIPSYRPDITIKDDISEEVIRLLGYDSLNATLPLMDLTLGALNDKQKRRRLVERILCDAGLQQIVSYSLVSNSHIEHGVMPLGEKIALASPLSEERKYVRTSLLPSMLDSVSYNVARNNYNVNVFELSNVYAQGKYQERLGIVISGCLQQLPWLKVKLNADFYMLKGIIETLLERLGFDRNRIFIKENTLDTSTFHKNKSATIYLGKELLGIFGVAHPSVLKAQDLKDAIVCELNFDLLTTSSPNKISFTPLPKYPSIKRDLALVVDKEISVEKIIGLIRKNGSKLVNDVEIFDIYENENLGANKKSVALSISYYSLEKTLSDNEILPINNQIIESLTSELKAVLRS